MLISQSVPLVIIRATGLDFCHLAYIVLVQPAVTGQLLSTMTIDASLEHATQLCVLLLQRSSEHRM